MHISTLLFGCGLAPFALAAYSIQDDYSGNNFFSLFTFDTENDPTSGYVNYVDRSTAQANNLTSVNDGVVTISSDSTSVASGRGRNSVRLTSTKQYTHALVVLDLAHMPGSACGIWPAFWMVGPSWPHNGEIDIIEGINLQAQDAITMHSGPSCSMIGKSCDGGNGCSTQVGGPTSYGDGFNKNGGGIYAMEWTSDHINVYFFPHSNAPTDALGAAPDPTTWGTPTASFVGGSTCDIDANFQNNNIVIDTTFCGIWAGSAWSGDPVCGPKAATCQDYVKNNPAAFTEAYWTINSLKVYTQASSSAAAAAVVHDTPRSSSTPAVAAVTQATTTTVSVATSRIPAVAPVSQATTTSLPVAASFISAVAPVAQDTTTSLPVAASSISAVAPVAQATTTSVPVAASSTSPSVPASTVAVTVGSPADGEAVSETPVTDNGGMSVGSNGQIQETPEKREVRSSAGSPNVKHGEHLRRHRTKLGDMWKHS